MTKPEALDTLMLLSALESWAFSQETMLPDYLHDRLSATVELLRTEVLKSGDILFRDISAPERPF